MSPADEEILRDLEQDLAAQKQLVKTYHESAVAGWESARVLAIAGLHRATEKAADEALAKLRSSP